MFRFQLFSAIPSKNPKSGYRMSIFYKFSCLFCECNFSIYILIRFEARRLTAQRWLCSVPLTSHRQPLEARNVMLPLKAPRKVYLFSKQSFSCGGVSYLRECACHICVILPLLIPSLCHSLFSPQVCSVASCCCACNEAEEHCHGACRYER